MTGPLPVTARLDEAFRSIAALQRHPGFFISLRGSTSLYNVFASPARYRREDADPFTPPFTPPRGRPRRRRARAPHLPLSEFANMGNDDQILVEIELKWTENRTRSCQTRPLLARTARASSPPPSGIADRIGFGLRPAGVLAPSGRRRVDLVSVSATRSAVVIVYQTISISTPRPPPRALPGAVHVQAATRSTATCG